VSLPLARVSQYTAVSFIYAVMLLNVRACCLDSDEQLLAIA